MNSSYISSLYYITYIHNLPSILSQGILSHKKVDELNVSYAPIFYDKKIVTQRKNKGTSDKDSLWEYANLYFQPRNPMMYRVVNETDPKKIAIIGIKPGILRSPGILISDGNAASNPTKFFSVDEGTKVLKKQWKIIQSDWWNNEDGSKRKIMSECLVPEQIPPQYIHSIFVAGQTIKEKVEELLIGSTKVPIIPESHMFFKPRSVNRIGNNISLIDGDMFFSNMKTLTISVNLQGVMGKGLASRAKYQFPDVYVTYQDACKKKQITATQPYLYKREAYLDEELADLTVPIATPNAIKWFLLFATKRRWRDNSRIEDIEGGLRWIKRSYKALNMDSLAMPALGCGLGNLNWADIGPLICHHLHDIDMPVGVYLPREQTIDPEFKTADYLLKK